MIRVKSLHISSLHVFSNFVEIPSNPQLGLGLRLFNISIVVASDISSKVKFCRDWFNR